VLLQILEDEYKMGFTLIKSGNLRINARKDRRHGLIRII
jgi:hypothetical protein